MQSAKKENLKTTTPKEGSASKATNVATLNTHIAPGTKQKHSADPLEAEVIKLRAEKEKLLSVIKNRDRELKNSDKILGEQQNDLQAWERMYMDLTKRHISLFRCFTYATERECMRTAQLYCLTRGEEWKPSVQKIIEANKLPLHFN